MDRYGHGQDGGDDAAGRGVDVDEAVGELVKAGEKVRLVVYQRLLKKFHDGVKWTAEEARKYWELDKELRE